MTPRPLNIRKEDPGVASTYLKIADELRRSAADNVVNRRWTAAVTDAIRAGMHAADAVLIHRRGFRNNSPAHADVVEHLRREFGAEVERERTTLSRLIARKHQFDYEGRLATEREGTEAARRAEELYAWARGIVERPKA